MVILLGALLEVMKAYLRTKKKELQTMYVLNFLILDRRLEVIIPSRLAKLSQTVDIQLYENWVGVTLVQYG